MSLLERICSLNENTIDLDDAIEMSAMGKVLVDTYTSFKMVAPSQLTDALASLNRLIEQKRNDLLRAKMRDLQGKRAALRTTEEKRAELDRELEALQLQIGKP